MKAINMDADKMDTDKAINMDTDNKIIMYYLPICQVDKAG